MQPGHEEVAFALVPDLEVLPAELLDDSNTSAQEMRVRLKRNMEKMMSISLTWFPIGCLGDPYIYQNLGDFTRMWDFTWRVSDCEELVRVTHRR